ncbi:hypothetical protein PQX77_008782 [Marasmius sp. AFHP31]|nr:hypothetical protein PQX77_008782 [Marasmius sp. AFHP31]
MSALVNEDLDIASGEGRVTNKFGSLSKEQGPPETSEKKDIHQGHEGTDRPPLLTGKPTLERSWEVIMKEVSSLDDGLIVGWKEDIDTLLVFAGLFSAVVTAFTVKSYRWFEEAPEYTTVALLRQISQQLNNTVISPPQSFETSPSVVRINVLWFLSLIIALVDALVDALFALLCKQWLREHRQQVHTRTPSEALALRWLRNQSLKKWHVHSILASLPILLELAVFLFLAGILELLRARHDLIVATATIVVGLVTVSESTSVDIIRQTLQVTPDIRDFRLGPRKVVNSPVKFIMYLPPMEYVCPYKSSQAWATFQGVKFICAFPGFVRALHFLCRKRYLPSSERPTHKSSAWAFHDTMGSLANWSTANLEALQRHNVANVTPPFYELNAFRWLVAELRDSPAMIPHLQNVPKSIPPHLVMPAVHDQWFFLPDKEWDTGDIEKVLPSPSVKTERPIHYDRETFLGARRETTLFNRLLHIAHVLNNADRYTLHHPDLTKVLYTLYESAPNDFHSLGFPVHTIDKVLDDPIPPDLGAALSEIFAPEVDYTVDIPTTATTSSFIKLYSGLQSLTKMHTIVLRTQRPSSKAMDIVRRVHNLLENHFTPRPGYFPIPLSRLEEGFRRLSSGDSDNHDFGYLAAFSRHWPNADRWQKRKLVNIMSSHILQTLNIASPTYPSGLKVCPLLMSSAGLDLIAFVHTCLSGEERVIYELLHRENQIAWRDTIECVRIARPELLNDYFRLISHGGIDSLSYEDCHQQMNSNPPRHNTGDTDHRYHGGSRSSFDQKLSPECREDPEASTIEVRNGDEKGAIRMQSPLGVISGDSGGDQVPVEKGLMSGPGADRGKV